MTSRAAAIRYARALFDVVRAEGLDLQRAHRELSEFSDLVNGNETLQRALTNPAVPAARKRAVVEELVSRAGDLLGPVAKLLLLLAERDRLVLLPGLADAYRSRLMDHQNVVRAEVVTAEALPEDRMAALQDGLARATGRQVQLTARVDPRILGGAVARIGSTVYDGSITRQLERMREALTSAAD
jgi:F-type H+-transporting ATPase subunit delta